MSEIPANELLADCGLEAFDSEELDGCAVVDAFVIVRYQHPDWSNPRTAYVGSKSMADELRIGLLTMVNDRIRNVSISQWVDDE